MSKRAAKNAWSAGYQAQTRGKLASDNPETWKVTRLAWFDGFAQAETETFIPHSIPLVQEAANSRDMPGMWDK